MNAADLPLARLRALLPEPEYQALLRGEPLAAGVLVPACATARAELRALIPFIPTPVVRAQLVDPLRGRVRGDFWEGSLLFADMSGFTALSEHLSRLGRQGAEEISAIINRLFAGLVAELYTYCGASGGGILKFGGDALTAFFDQQALGDHHAELAAAAALAMQRRMAGFDALSTRAGTFRLRLRVGVHSGQLFAAQVGDHEHIELVITGRNVNRVALAQEISEPGEVVVSRETLGLLAGARAEPRQAEFFVLRALPEPPPPPELPAPAWQPPADTLDELLALARRIDALSPYITRGLPRRYLDAGDEPAIGEFRPVTVMFTNFYPFSQILDQLATDPQTAARALNAYYARAQAAVHRYGGVVNKVDMSSYGDKLMALFGAPVAHEEDALLAVRAALDLRQALAEANAAIAALAPGAPLLAQRTGINTATVFTGQVGAPRRHEYTVMGPGVNLAARLMSAADEGVVLLSPGTRRQVARAVTLRELPPLKLKGIAEPVAAAAAEALLMAGNDGGGGLQPARLVGRDAQLDTLAGLGMAALRGSGQVVALVGEAGSGKSRVAGELMRALVTASARREQPLPAFLTYLTECQNYEQTTPYATARELLRQVLELPLGAHPDPWGLIERRCARLAPDLVRFAPLLGDILGISLPESALTSALAPEQRHARAFDLALALLAGECARQPLLVLIDDLHWADASSIELIERLAQAAARLPVLLLLVYRTEPGIAEPWAELPHSTRLALEPLTPDQSLALVEALLGGPPPRALVPRLERAQGNPFFLEELVRALVEERLLLPGDQGWVLSGAIDDTALPDSIEGVILARLDRLEERPRDLLQHAAVIGRRFAYRLLEGVYVQRAGLMEGLEHLASADLITPDGLERDPIYLFKYTLTRDVAYASILFARRRELHRRVAYAMEQLYAGRSDEQHGLLGRHYLLAEAWAPAFEHLMAAGIEAQRRYANREAIELFEQALHAARQISPPQLAGEAELLEHLGQVHLLIGENDTALERFDAALSLRGSLPATPPADLLRLHRQIARTHERRSDFESALAWVERALALPGADDQPELAQVYLMAGGVALRQGRYQQGIDWAVRAQAVAERHGSEHDLAHACKLQGALYTWLGDNARAVDVLQQSISLYEQTRDLPGLADAHSDLANTLDSMDRWPEAIQHYQAAATLKESIGDAYGQAMVANNLGDLLRRQGAAQGATAQFRRSLALFEQIGSQFGRAVLLMNTGAALLMQGDLEAADESLRAAVALFTQLGADQYFSEARRYQAELALVRGEAGQARDLAAQALADAQAQAARPEEGAARRVLGMALERLGALDEAWQQYELSCSVFHDAHARLELARARVRLAALAPRVGRLADGYTALVAALDDLNDLGAHRDLQEARALATIREYAGLVR